MFFEKKNFGICLIRKQNFSKNKFRVKKFFWDKEIFQKKWKIYKLGFEQLIFHLNFGVGKQFQSWIDLGLKHCIHVLLFLKKYYDQMKNNWQYVITQL